MEVSGFMEEKGGVDGPAGCSRSAAATAVTVVATLARGKLPEADTDEHDIQGDKYESE